MLYKNYGVSWENKSVNAGSIFVCLNILQMGLSISIVSYGIFQNSDGDPIKDIHTVALFVHICTALYCTLHACTFLYIPGVHIA